MKEQFRTPVPEEDLEAALKSIENTIDNIYNTRVLSKVEHNTQSVDAIKESSHERMQKCILSQVQTDFSNRLKAVADPIPASDYNSRYIGYSKASRYDFYRDVDYDDISCCSSSDSSSFQLSDEGEIISLSSAESCNIDDEELLDQQAFSKVKELRAQVREAAGKNLALREEAVGITVDILQQEMSVHFDTSSCDEILEEKTKKNPDDLVSSTFDFKGMKESLRLFFPNLVTTDKKLQEKLDSLTKTIDFYLAKDESNDNKSENDETANNAQSNIERIILSRDDCEQEVIKQFIVESEKEQREEKEKGEVMAEEVFSRIREMTPNKRFGLFMS